MQKFVKTKEQIDFYGTILEITRPTSLQMSAYREKLKKAKETHGSDEQALIQAQADLLIELLITLGMTKEVLDNMEEGHATEFVEYLFTKKK